MVTRPIGAWFRPSPSVIAAGLVGFAAAAVATVLVWAAYQVQPHGLRPPVAVVGYPSAYGFDYLPPFRTYRLVVWGWPLTFLGVRFLLTRLTTREAVVPAVEPLAEAPQRPIGSASGPVRLLLPALVVAVVVSGVTGSSKETVGLLGLACGAALVALTSVVAIAMHRLQAAREMSYADRLAISNAVVGCLSAVVAGFIYSRTTRVVTPNGDTSRWPFFPWWLAIAVAILAVVLVIRTLPRRSPRWVEFVALALLPAATLVFIATGRMGHPVGPFQGFDDAQSVVGADLLSRGLIPWRDFIFIHGAFEDALRSSLGFLLFGHTVWGADTALHLIWTPMCWVGLVWLAAWACAGRGAVLVVVTALLLVAEQQWIVLSVQYARWVGGALVLLLLGLALKDVGRRWTILLTIATFGYGILVPESAYLAFGVMSGLMLSDVSGHSPHEWWSSLRRTKLFFGTGAFLTAAWAAVLATNHSLSAFVDYYVIFASDHAASGAHPASIYATPGFIQAFKVNAVLTAITLVLLLGRLLGGHRLTPRQGVLLAAALLSALYGEKALGRFDDPHIVESLFAALPMSVVGLSLLLSALDDRLVGMAPSDGPALLSRVSRGGQVVASLIAVILLPLSVVPGVVWHAPGHHVGAVDSLRETPELGYESATGIDHSLVGSLGWLMTRLGGRTPVFDFTNSPGYVYYLLGRAPAVPFTNVSMAITPYAQRLLVDQLRTSRPPVVVFDSATIGLPSWDGIRNEVRHYAVSQYLLDHWTPVALSYGELVLLRNDLVATMPVLAGDPFPVTTSNLYLRSPECDWAETPNFLPSLATGRSITLPVTRSRDSGEITARGWVFDGSARRSVRHILVADGRRVLGGGSTVMSRPDARSALSDGAARRSGFHLTFRTRPGVTPTVYAELSDGLAHPLAGGGAALPSGARLRVRGGGRVTVSATPATGRVDELRTAVVSFVRVPDWLRLSDYMLAQFRADGAVGDSLVQVSDSSSFATSHVIAFHALPLSGDRIPVRVGSCLQWHGYRGRRLFLRQTGGAPVTELRLSGVG